MGVQIKTYAILWRNLRMFLIKVYKNKLFADGFIPEFILDHNRQEVGT